MLGTMHRAVVCGCNILQLSESKDMANVQGKGIIMLMMTEEGNKNRNIVRTHRTKRSTESRSLRRNRKHNVEWRRNRTRINVKPRMRRSGGDKYLPLEDSITRNPGPCGAPRFLGLGFVKPNLSLSLTRTLLENCSPNAGHLIRVSWSETWRIIITGIKALRLSACVRTCVFSIGNERRLYLIDLIQKPYHVQAGGHKYLPT